jgi:hypothetical protein
VAEAQGAASQQTELAGRSSPPAFRLHYNEPAIG